MANTNPPEMRPIATSVPNRASGTATTPLNQPISVSPMGSPAATQPATPLRPVDGGGAGRQAPSNVSQPSGQTSGYPANVNMPAPSPDGMPKRGRP
jgi:hypothetical protein